MYAFNTTRGNIHLEFASKEEADEVYDSWQPKYLGEASIVRKITNTGKPNRAVIIKGVPKELTDKEIQNSLNEQFDGSKGTRFEKIDSTVLGTVKIVLKTDGDVQKALEHDLFHRYDLLLRITIQSKRDSNHTMLQVPEVRTCERKLQIRSQVWTLLWGTLIPGLRDQNKDAKMFELRRRPSTKLSIMRCVPASTNLSFKLERNTATSCSG